MYHIFDTQIERRPVDILELSRTIRESISAR
jgi:hypothetical protein